MMVHSRGYNHNISRLYKTVTKCDPDQDCQHNQQISNKDKTHSKDMTRYNQRYQLYLQGRNLDYTAISQKKNSKIIIIIIM